MSSLDKMNELKTGFQDQLVQAQDAIEKINTKIGLVDGAIADKAIEDKANYDAGYQQCLEDTNQVNSPDKRYSDAEMEAELAPLKATIETLNAEKVAMTEQFAVDLNDALAKKEAEMKAMFHQKLSAVKVDDEALLAEFAPV